MKLADIARAPTKLRFADGDWTGDFKSWADEEPPMLPKDWLEQVTVEAPPWESTDVEVRYLEGLKPFRKTRDLEIRTQARTATDAIWPVQQVVGQVDLPPRLATKELSIALMDNLYGPIFTLKRAFERARATRLSTTIDPMFPPADRLHPGHPSYPSGHSTQAYSLAFLYATLFPELTGPLLSAAHRVAFNREVAGLHFPSDSMAGMMLAQQLVRMLLKNAAFRSLAKAAELEMRVQM